MTQHDRQAFALFMLGLGEVYGESVSDTRMELYFAALVDLPLESIRAAATVHVRTQKFFPRPAELREAVGGTTEDRAELAWTKLLSLIRTRGWVNPPDWDDDVLRRAACDLYGGWQALCENLPVAGPELLGMAKQFKAAYAAYCRREIRQIALPPSREEARAALSGLKAELEKRGLPTGSL